MDVQVSRNGDIAADGSVRWDRLPTRGFKRSETARSVVTGGDVLLTTSGNCGQVAMVDDDPAGTVCVSNF